MNINEYYKSESDYLRAEEIPVGKLFSVTIKSIEEVIFETKNGKAGTRKLAATFNETEKKLVLNKTNSMTIASMYGSESDNWPGKIVKLYQTKVSFGDEMVDAIRIDLPREEALIQQTPSPQQRNLQQLQQAPPNFDQDFSDDIPF